MSFDALSLWATDTSEIDDEPSLSAGSLDPNPGPVSGRALGQPGSAGSLTRLGRWIRLRSQHNLRPT